MNYIFGNPVQRQRYWYSKDPPGSPSHVLASWQTKRCVFLLILLLYPCPIFFFSRTPPSPFCPPLNFDSVWNLWLPSNWGTDLPQARSLPLWSTSDSVVSHASILFWLFLNIKFHRRKRLAGGIGVDGNYDLTQQASELLDSRTWTRRRWNLNVICVTCPGKNMSGAVDFFQRAWRTCLHAMLYCGMRNNSNLFVTNAIILWCNF